RPTKASGSSTACWRGGAVSVPARRKSCATSSASACWGCRRTEGALHGLDAGSMALGQRLVGSRIDLHPALGRCSGERPLDFTGGTERQHAAWNLRPGRDQCSSPDHGAGPDSRAVEDRAAVSDQGFFSDVGAMDQAEMRDRGAGADLDAVDRCHMEDRAVLHVGSAADDDRRKVGAHDGVVPDGGVLLDGHVADDGRSRRDERGRMDAGRLAFERVERHRRLLVSRRFTTRPILPGLRWTRQGGRAYSSPMSAPKIIASATASPPYRWDQAALLRLSGYEGQ